MEKKNFFGVGCGVVLSIFLVLLSVLPIVGAIAAKVAGYILLFKISEWSFHWYYIETDIKFMTISMYVALWMWYFIALVFITEFFTSAYKNICKRIKNRIMTTEEYKRVRLTAGDPIEFSFRRTDLG